MALVGAGVSVGSLVPFTAVAFVVLGALVVVGGGVVVEVDVGGEVVLTGAVLSSVGGGFEAASVVGGVVLSTGGTSAGGAGGGVDVSFVFCANTSVFTVKSIIAVAKKKRNFLFILGLLSVLIDCCKVYLRL